MVVFESQIEFITIEDQYKTSVFEQIVRRYIIRRPTAPGGGGTWVFFGWVCAARDSKLAPRSKKNFP